MGSNGRNGCLPFVSSYFRWFVKQSRKFQEIRSNDDARRRSKIFGVQALLFMILGIGLGLMIIFGGSYMITNGGFWGVLFGIVVVVCGGAAILTCVPCAITSAVFQLRMRLGLFSILSTLVVLAIAVLAIIGTVFLFSYLGLTVST